MSIINTQPLIGASGNQVTGYNLTKSVRLRASADAGFSKTFASSGSRTKHTFSFWAKFDSNAGAGYREFIYEQTATYNFVNLFQYQGKLQYFGRDLISGNIINYTLATDAVFRDPAAWYHIVYSIDYTQATAANRVKIYVNGVQYALTATNDGIPPQNWNGYLNVSGSVTYIGRSGGGDNYDGYLAEMYFIDGYQLTPADFGETDIITGVWKPKAFSGTYGTNGFYLPFTDVATTSGSNAGLGKDFSGNGNYWTTNNISVTTGSTYDSMTDVPTLTDASTANYCVLNAVRQGGGTHSNGNLKYVGAGTSATYSTTGTMAVNSGKWYWEVTVTGAPYTPRGSTSWYNAFGFTLATEAIITTSPTTTTNTLNYQDSGYYKNFSGSNTDTGSAVSNGDVLAVAVDLDANTFTFYKNNTSVASGTIGVTAGTSLIPLFYSYDGTYGQLVANFGQRPFAYTPPSGFKALNTFNLPTSTIVAGNTSMDVLTWTGTSTASGRTFTGLQFQPDFIWAKSRSGAYNHQLYDSNRGTGKRLESNSTGAETTNPVSGYVSAFNSNGFTTIAGSTDNSWFNETGTTYVGWNWKAGQGTTSSNTQGSITSTVSVNASAGFSIVTYTGTGSAATVGHGLGVAPRLIIVKNRNPSGAPDWAVYHGANPATVVLGLNDTYGNFTQATWNNTAPTSSVFSVGTFSSVNESTKNIVAYCWAEIAGFSKFGSYTGNGSTDGPFIYTGFRPKYILIKNTGSISGYGDWYVWDSVRNTYNIAGSTLRPNTSDQEYTNNTAYALDVVSNGFKVRNSYNDFNASGYTYIYACFAENPFKNSLAR